MIVIGTLSRALSGGDESSSVDMGQFVRNVDRLREEADCAVLVVHPSGKSPIGSRGWSGLQGNIDIEIEIKAAEKIIHSEKQRDLEKS